MKAKKSIKRASACFVAVVLMLSTFPLSALTGLELSEIIASFGFSARAESYDWEELDYEEVSKDGVIYRKYENGKAAVCGYEADELGEDLTIPASIDDYPVVEISGEAFLDCKKLINVIISDGIESIEDGAFLNCASLKSISVPESVTYIANIAIGYNYNPWIGWEPTDRRLVIRGKRGTCAERYAIENKFDFEVDCRHGESSHVIYSAVEESCTAEGYTAGIYCNECKDWISGHAEVKAHHTDENKDHVCDLCNEQATVTSGACGDSAAYKLFFDGELEISGSGELYELCDANLMFNEYKEQIKSVTVQDGITKLGTAMFADCSNLEKVSLPSSVTDLGNWTFCYCVSLSEFTIPSGVTMIGDSVFGSCEKLKKIVIPDGVTSIGEAAFANTALESVTLGKGLQKIMYSVFDGCKKLKNIEFPEGLILIGTSAFANTALESVNFPASLEMIGENAFYNCPALTQVTVPGGVKTIGSEALGWYQNEAVENFVIKGYTNTAAESYALENEFLFKTACEHGETSHKTVPALAETCTEDGYTEGVFCNDCGFWVSGHKTVQAHHTDENKDRVCDICQEDAAILSGQCGENATFSIYSDGEAIIRGTGKLKNYKYNKRSPFTKNYKYIKKLTVESGITSLGNYMFKDCSLLEEVQLPEGLEKVNADAFRGCTALKTIVLPQGLEEIDDSAFGGCTALSSITFPSSLKVIEYFAFSYCTALKEISLPEGIESIKYGTFRDCTALSKIKFPLSLKVIEQEAFYYCPALTEVTVPGNVETIGSEALGWYWVNGDDEDGYSERIDNFVIKGYANTAAESYALENEFLFKTACEHGETSHKTVPALAETCTEDGYTEGVFCNDCGFWVSGHRTVKAHHTDENNDRVCDICQEDAAVYSGKCGGDVTFRLYNDGELVLSGSGETYYEYDNTLADIEHYVLSLTVEEGITDIGAYIFGGYRQLKTVVLPYSLERIGSHAFENCTALSEVYLRSSLVEIGSGASYKCESLKEISIPGSVKFIGGAAFAKTGLEEVSIPKNVIEVGYGAFKNCKSLESATVAAAEIGDSAFEDCSKLSSVMLAFTQGRVDEEPTGKTEYIGEKAFAGCALERVNIPPSVKQIGNNAFGYNGSAEYDIYDEEERAYFKNDSFVVFGSPDSAAQNYAEENGFTFKNAGRYHRYTLALVQQPSCSEPGRIGLVCNICGILRVASIPAAGHRDKNADGVCDYCEAAGVDAGEPLVITVPDDVTVIGSYAFRGREFGGFAIIDRVEGIVFPDGIRRIEEYAFTGFSGITELDFGNSLEYIGESAFMECGNLKKINIGNSVKYIGEGAFCFSGIESITIPGSLKTIPDMAFTFAYNLKEIVIENGVEDITGEGAFAACAVQRVTIPESVKNIGDTSFAFCWNLEEFKVSENNKNYTSVDGVLYDKGVKTLIAYPADKKDVSYRIPDGVETTSPATFGNNLESVIFPQSIKTIGVTLSGEESGIDMTSFGWKFGKFNFTGETRQELYDYVGSYPSIVKDDGFEIKGYPGTDAETYANKYGFKFVDVSEGHTHCVNAWTVTKEPSCTEKGEKSGLCSDCETTVTKELAPLGHELKRETKASTCTEKGFEKDVCSRCKEEFNFKELPLAEHTFSAFIVTKEPDCTRKGTKERTCGVCKYADTQEIPALGHDLKHESKTSTCTEKGFEKDVCSRCNGEFNFKELPLAQHDFIGRTVIKKPTCTEKGESISVCNSCKLIDSQEIAPLGHDLKHEIKASTCTEKGFEKDVCSRCEEEFNFKELPLAEHTFTEFSVTKEPDCTQKGTKERTCNVCKYVDTQEIPALGHDLKHESKTSTCTEKGFEKDVCSRCKEEFNFKELPLAEHTFSVQTVIKESTCTEAGEVTVSCSLCGYGETQETKPLGHDFSHDSIQSTCAVEGEEFDVCLRCRKVFNRTKLPLLPHSYGDWEFTVEPTCTSEGEKTRVCSACGKRETTAAEKATHSFGEWAVTKEATAEETGEKERFCHVCGFTEKEVIEKLPLNEAKDEKTGIVVEYPENSYDGTVEIAVTETFGGAQYETLNAEKGKYQKLLFDITTTVDGKAAQPSEPVFVKIPLPAGYNPEKTVVYHVTDDGKLEKTERRFEDGYIVFAANHFSYYAIVDETEKTEPVNPPQPDPSANCSCACHKGGIAKFFFKIGLFFQKIFGKNRMCTCGVSHY